jgi:hypothetical protein
MSVERALTAALLAVGALALFALVLLLAATPPFECGEDYADPPTPLHTGTLAVACFVAGLAGLVAAIVVRARTRRPTRTLRLGLVVSAVAFAGCYADLTRWTCWP